MSLIRFSVAALALMLTANALQAQASPRAQRSMMQDTTKMPCPKPAMRDSAMARGGAMGGNMAAPAGAMSAGSGMAAPRDAMKRDSAMTRGAMMHPNADSTKSPCVPMAGAMDGGQMKKPDAMGDGAMKKSAPMRRPPRD